MQHGLGTAAPPRRWARISWGVLVVGITISLAAGYGWQRSVAAQDERSFEGAAAGVAASLNSALSRNADAAASVAALARSMRGITNRQFQDWYSAIGEERPAGSPSIGFIRYVPGSQLSTYLASRQGDIGTDGTTIAATHVAPPGSRTSYCLVELGVWHVQEFQFPPGLDFCAMQPAMLVEAENRRTTVTPAVSRKSLEALGRMIGGSVATPTPALRRAYFYYTPVFERDAAVHNGDLHPGLIGWVGGLFDPHELVAASAPASANLNVSLSHENDSGEIVSVVRATPRTARFHRRFIADVDGRWMIDIAGSGAGGVSPLTQGLIVGLIAIAMNLLVFVLFRVLASAQSNAVTLVDRRTGELRLANEDRAQLLKGTLEVAEREQSRLAAELHDGPIQKLTASGFVVDRAIRRLRQNDLDTAKTLLEQVRKELSADTAALRTMMVELRPPLLDEAGLGAALRSYAEAFSARTGIDIEFVDGLDDIEIPHQLEVALYRIGQQSLANIDRHAAATRVVVDLHVDNGDIELVVTDNGRGFDASTTTALLRDGHYGLAGMRERIEVAGGTWHLQSTPGKGTSIAARAPIGLPTRERELLDAAG